MPCDHPDHEHDKDGDRHRGPGQDGRRHDDDGHDDDGHDGCGHGHHHGRAHALSPAQLDRAMAAGVGLNLAFVALEFGCGLYAGSLALLADAGHNAGDVIGLLLAWAASRVARLPPTPRYTWGFRRSTIFAALANAVLLLTASGAILWEAVLRLRSPEPVQGPVMIAVAAVGVLVNAVTAAFLARGGSDANIRAAFLHMAADAAVSVGVVVAGVAILLTGFLWIDPAVSIAITLAIVAGTWGLFRESVDMALDAVPRGVDPNAILAALSRLPGVAEVHDLHVWGASTSEVSLTAHVVVPEPLDHREVLAAATTLLRERFAVAHTTIQLECDEACQGCSQRPADVL
jgi:cobalt-zinc-cadmium efflux system protein